MYFIIYLVVGGKAAVVAGGGGDEEGTTPNGIAELLRASNYTDAVNPSHNDLDRLE